MPIVVVCNRCGHERSVLMEDLRAGTWKDRCPVCRPAADDRVAAGATTFRAEYASDQTRAAGRQRIGDS